MARFWGLRRLLLPRGSCHPMGHACPKPAGSPSQAHSHSLQPATHQGALGDEVPGGRGPRGAQCHRQAVELRVGAEPAAETEGKGQGVLQPEAERRALRRSAGPALRPSSPARPRRRPARGPERGEGGRMALSPRQRPEGAGPGTTLPRVPRFRLPGDQHSTRAPTQLRGVPDTRHSMGGTSGGAPSPTCSWR